MSPMVLVKKSTAALPAALISTFEPLPMVLVAGSRLSLWPYNQYMSSHFVGDLAHVRIYNMMVLLVT